MHPKMMIALGHEFESDRQRERRQLERRSRARRQRGMDATTRIAGHEFVWRLLVLPRLLTRLP